MYSSCPNGKLPRNRRQEVTANKFIFSLLRSFPPPFPLPLCRCVSKREAFPYRSNLLTAHWQQVYFKLPQLRQLSALYLITECPSDSWYAAVGLYFCNLSIRAPFLRIFQEPILFGVTSPAWNVPWFSCRTCQRWRSRKSSAARCSSNKFILALRKLFIIHHFTFWSPVWEVKDKAMVFGFSDRVVPRLQKVGGDQRLALTKLK